MDHLAFASVVARIDMVCRIAAPRAMLHDLRQSCRETGLTAAVARRDTAVLYDWLIRMVSLQGVSDAIAWRYMDQYGSVSFAEIAAALAGSPACPRLRSHWHFADCGFTKGSFSCNEPHHIELCPLPRHDLRNGRLNQTAYSLFLFLRDVCGGDLVGWLDARLAIYDLDDVQVRAAALRSALLDPLSCIYGVSSKVLSMTLADLLLAAGSEREHWVGAGAAMIAVDSLVHNWLHRTGSLHALGAEHPYGPRCYAPGGCADIIRAASEHIDARQLCPDGPTVFPRLVQVALWHFCAEGGLDVCNGRRIDDRFACAQNECHLFAACARRPLRPSKLD